MRMRAARGMAPRDAHEGALRYYDLRFGTAAVKILPGEYAVDGDGLLMVTTLGSCVSACLFDPAAGVGGMNHFLLPEGDDGPAGASARYGSYAMELLINRLLGAGAQRHRLRAKVFGGANVLAGFSGMTVGQRNARFVLDYLAREGVPVEAQDLGGEHARRVYFFPAGGRALVRMLPRCDDTLRAAELRYRSKLAATAPTGEVELF